MLRCDVVAPLVGPKWLTVQDEYGRRRLDVPDDVVHQEIATALQEGKTVLPIILGKENVPRQEALPETLKAAFVRQAIILENDALPADVDRVIQALTALGFIKINTPAILPDPRKKSEPLNQDEIALALEELPGWTVSTSFAEKVARQHGIPIQAVQIFRVPTRDALYGRLRRLDPRTTASSTMAKYLEYG